MNANRIPHRTLAVLLLALAAGASHARRPVVADDPMPDGWLCCNMRVSHHSMDDINYRWEGAETVPLGTRATVYGYLPRRVQVVLGGVQMELANDYSRSLSLPDYAKRFVVATNPADRLATFPAPIRQSIAASKLRIGMTREQVFMSLGMPIVSYNADDHAKMLRYWTDFSHEFQLTFEEDGLVRVTSDEGTRRVVLDEDVAATPATAATAASTPKP